MNYQLYIYAHDDYEPINEFFEAGSKEEAYYKVRWQYPYLNKRAFELKLSKEC